MKIPSQNSFVLGGGNELFANRQKALFDQLLQVEKNVNVNEDSKIPLEINSTTTSSSSSSSRNLQIAKRNHREIRDHSETHHLRGKESIFKRPEIPAPKTKYRSIPDYHKNPHKWVKYDLDDITNKEMSDKSNTQAALSFLHGLKQRKESEKYNTNKYDKMDTEDININCPSTSTSTSTKISFRKPSKNNLNNNIIANNDKPTFRNSTIIYPEYVVGQKQQKKIKKDKKIIKSDKQLKLDHLLEYEDDY